MDFIVFTVIAIAMPCAFALVAVGAAAAESFFHPRGGMMFGFVSISLRRSFHANEI